MRYIKAIIVMLALPGITLAQSWVRLSDVNWSGEITTLRTDPVTMFMGNMRSEDGGRTWASLNQDTIHNFKRVFAVHPARDSVVFFEAIHHTNGPRIMITSDAGKSFVDFGRPYISGHYLNKLFISPRNPDVMHAEFIRSDQYFAYYYAFSYSSNGGQTWTDTIPTNGVQNDQPLSKNATVPHILELQVTAYHPFRGGILFNQHYHEQDEPPIIWETFGKLEDGIDGPGKNIWISKLNRAIQEFVFTPATADTMFFTSWGPGSYKRSVHMSTDSGDHWTEIVQNSNAVIKDIAYDSRASNIVLATANGIEYSTDLGQSWATRNSGLRSLAVRDLHTDHNWNIYALTDEGLYIWDALAPVGVDVTPPPVPERLALSAYPNPGSGEVQVQFDLPRDSYTELAVYDVYGRRVMLLADGYLSRRHNNNYTLNASTLPAGLYFITLRAAGQSIMKKIVVGR